MKLKEKLLLAIVLTLFCTLFSPGSLFSEDHLPFESIGEGPTFYVDYSNFKAEDNKSYVEFYFQFGYQYLQFIKVGKKFKAEYDFNIKIIDGNGVIVGEQKGHDLFQVDSFKETYETKKARISLIAFTLEAGKYIFQCNATDLETKKSSKIEGYVSVKDFKTTELLLSDIQFSQNIYLAEEDLPYVKNQRYVEPNAVRVFSFGLADIYVYFEVYNLDLSDKQNQNYTAFFSIFDETGKQYAQIKRQHVKPGLTSAHSIKLPIDYFLSGKYSLTVKVIDEAHNAVTETSKAFQVLDTPVTLNEISQEYLLN